MDNEGKTVEDMIFEERRKQIDLRWKSDVDLKLDSLVAFSKKYETLLQMLIEREAKRERLRSAIIEKTLSALVLAAVVGLLSLAWSGLTMDLKTALQAIRGTK